MRALNIGRCCTRLSFLTQAGALEATTGRLRSRFMQGDKCEHPAHKHTHTHTPLPALICCGGDHVLPLQAAGWKMSPGPKRSSLLL